MRRPASQKNLEADEDAELLEKDEQVTSQLLPWIISESSPNYFAVCHLCAGQNNKLTETRSS
jgi:hypothetical protein